MELQIDGRTAYAYTGGKPFDATLPCVVFLHGALHDHSVWTLLARWFAHHGHAVLAPDLPGHGRSSGPLLPSVEALADWALALVKAARSARPAAARNDEPVAWVGHSMGSLIALEAAARAPAQARRLAMLATAFPMQVSDSLLRAAVEDPAGGMDLVNAFSFSTLAAKPAFPGPGAWLHGGNRQLMGRVLASHPAGNVFAHDFGLCNAYTNGWAAAAAVTCPAHLVLGRADQMTPTRASRSLATALRAAVTVLPGGHALMQEQPEALLAALRGVLA